MFKCKSCGRQFGANTPEVCPDCGKSTGEAQRDGRNLAFLDTLGAFGCLLEIALLIIFVGLCSGLVAKFI